MNELDEMTISFKDLLCRILLRWRLMFVCMLLGAVLLGGIGYLKNAKKASVEKADVTNEQRIEGYEETLTEADIQSVNAAVDTYWAYQKSCKFMEEYRENSIRMKLDANRLPTIQLQYLIDTHYEAVYPVVERKDMTADIANSYQMKIRNTAVYEEIAEKMTDGTDASYISELITTGMNNDLFFIIVNGMTEEDCQRIADTLKVVIDKETERLRELYGDYDIVLIDESYFEYASSELLEEQRRQIADYNNQIIAMNGLSANMTEEQKGYYEALMKGEEPETTEKEAPTETEQAGNGFQIGYVSKKYILLGGGAGIFLVCCYVACRYLVSACLRVKEDLEECFGIVNLGTIPVHKPKKKIMGCVDRWIISRLKENNSRFSEEDRYHMICAGIRIGAKKSDMQSVYLTGVCNDEFCEQIKALLCNKMEGSIETVRYGKSVVYDPESLEMLVSSDGVVLVERINGSRYDELKKEIEICRQNQIKIIGSVILN